MPTDTPDAAAERLSDLVAYDPDMRLVLAELPRLQAALAAAEAKLAARDRWVRDVAVCYDLPYDGDDLFAAVARFVKRIRQELSAEREKRRASEEKLAEALRTMLDAVSDLGDDARAEFPEPAVEAAGAALAEYVAQPAGPGEADTTKGE